MVLFQYFSYKLHNVSVLFQVLRQSVYYQYYRVRNSVSVYYVNYDPLTVLQVGEWVTEKYLCDSINNECKTLQITCLGGPDHDPF